VLTDLAAKLPAAVLADLLHPSPGTAVRWMHEAGGDCFAATLPNSPANACGDDLPARGADKAITSAMLTSMPSAGEKER
jgi:hypothetical protein